MKKKLKLIALGIGIISISVILSFIYTNNIVEKDLIEFNLKIEKLFKSNETLTDGIMRPVSGSMSKNNMVFKSDFKHGDAFIILKLSKKDNIIFNKETITPAGTITYKDSEYNTFSTYRPSPEQCYIDAYNYILKGKSNQNSYTPNKYDDIFEFPSQLNTKYHYIYEKYYNSFSENHETGNIFNGIWTMEYYTEKNQFIVDTYNSEIRNLTITNMILFFGLGVVFYLLVLLSIKYVFSSKTESKLIFNKKWKNTQNNSILVINKNNLGKFKVTIIEDGKAKKGIAKITDKGTSLQLSFEDQEYFYKIILLNPLKLELENLITSTVLKYELLGSNAYSPTENNDENQISMPVGEIATKDIIVDDSSLDKVNADVVTDKSRAENIPIKPIETTKIKEYKIQKKWLLVSIIALILVFGSLLFYTIYNSYKETSYESTKPKVVEQPISIKSETKNQNSTEKNTNPNKKLKIGDYYAGGIIFYVDKSGEHGKVCTNKDLGRETNWNKANQFCNNLSSNGYTDWYLPTLSELKLIYKNLRIKKGLKFDFCDYWSSTQIDRNYVWSIGIDGIGNQFEVPKINIGTLQFRAVRVF